MEYDATSFCTLLQECISDLLRSSFIHANLWSTVSTNNHHIKFQWLRNSPLQTSYRAIIKHCETYHTISFFHSFCHTTMCSADTRREEIHILEYQMRMNELGQGI
jgi:hypothetical protein